MAKFKYLYTDGDDFIHYEADSFGPDDISLAEGNMMVGDSAGLATSLDVGGTDGGIPIGNGTTVTVQTMSGDATLANDGTLTLANDAVNADKLLDALNTIPVIIDITAGGQALPAPTGSNQLDEDLVVFAIPSFYQTVEIVGAQLISNTATTNSDADSHYEFEIYNTTDAESLSSTAVSTVDTELSVASPYALTVDQNQTLQAGDQLALRVDIYDDGSPNPTDLSGANLQVVVYLRPLT